MIGRTIAILGLLFSAPVFSQWLVQSSGKPVVAGIAGTPSFSPVAGAVASGTVVTFSSSTAGATFCSTVDNSTPTANGAGTCTHGATGGTVTVSSAETVKVIASKTGYTDSSVASAAYTLASGSVTAANLKLSTIAGTALVDFNASGLLCPYLNDKITITDGSAHTVVGWIKACGSSETLGSELLANTTFNDTTGLTAPNATLSSVTTGDCSSQPSGHCLQTAATSTNGGGAFEGSALTVGYLLKATGFYKKGTESTLAYFTLFRSGFGALATVSGTPSTLTAATLYGTSTASATFGLQLSNFTNGQTAMFATVSMKQVTAPSSTGVTIVSTQGGSTFNWASVNASFVYNGAVTYAITVN